MTLLKHWELGWQGWFILQDRQNNWHNRYMIVMEQFCLVGQERRRINCPDICTGESNQYYLHTHTHTHTRTNERTVILTRATDSTTSITFRICIASTSLAGPSPSSWSWGRRSACCGRRRLFFVVARWSFHQSLIERCALIMALVENVFIFMYYDRSKELKLKHRQEVLCFRSLYTILYIKYIYSFCYWIEWIKIIVRRG